MTKKTNTEPSINDLEWNDYVLNLLHEEEKIDGNPTTDGLRRIFEIALKCEIVESTSDVVQSPTPDNEKRATVVHKIAYILNNGSKDQNNKIRTVSGAADVYWGNCDKVYRNHPVAVAETRAEGRALRRALRLRKVVAAEELATNIEDNVDGESVNKISNSQINFMDVLCNRLDIDANKLIVSMGLPNEDYRNLTHSDAVTIIRQLSDYQKKINDIPEDIKGYTEEWK
jgi:hypothetical protein